MYRASRLRLIGLHAVLIASTLQGLTPDSQSVASPWALEWLRLPAEANGSDARLGRMPANDRPSVPDGSDRDETSAEVALPCEPGGQATLRRRLAHSQSHLMPAIAVGHAADAPVALRSERPGDPRESVTDLTISLRRLNC
jgi:hypothetical protein